MELLITDQGTNLGRSSDRFVIRRRDRDPLEIPIREVSNIVITGRGLSISTDAIFAMVENKIPVALLSGSGEPYAKIVAPDSLGHAELRRNQILALDLPLGVEIARAILRAKLRNQAANL